MKHLCGSVLPCEDLYPDLNTNKVFTRTDIKGKSANKAAV